MITELEKIKREFDSAVLNEISKQMLNIYKEIEKQDIQHLEVTFSLTGNDHTYFDDHTGFTLGTYKGKDGFKKRSVEIIPKPLLSNFINSLQFLTNNLKIDSDDSLLIENGNVKLNLRYYAPKTDYKKNKP